MPVERVERAISVVGAVHAFACLVYVSQRSYRWFAGTETTLALSQPNAIATAGLALQFVAALVLLLACLARACCLTRFDRWIAVSAIVLGLLWMYFGFADVFPNYARASTTQGIIRMAIGDVCREMNQALVPAILAFTFSASRSVRAVGVAALVVVIAGCLCYLVPATHNVYSIVSLIGWKDYWAGLSQSAYMRDLLVTAVLFNIAGSTLLVLRRPWRIVAALPFAAWLIRDMVVNIPERMDRWSGLSGIDLVLAVSRNLSFVTVMSTATLLGVFVFTVAGVPKPRLFGRRAG